MGYRLEVFAARHDPRPCLTYQHVRHIVAAHQP
jgi:hypothetical protein